MRTVSPPLVALALLAAGALARATPPAGGPRLDEVARALHSSRAQPLLVELVERARRGGRRSMLDRRVMARVRLLRDTPFATQPPSERAMGEEAPRVGFFARAEAARVVGELLAEATDPRGRIRIDELGRLGGLRARSLLDQLVRIADVDDLAERRIALFGGPRLIERLHRTAPVSNPRMRALEGLVDRHGPSAPFAGVDVLAVQHLLGSTGGLLRALVASGARADRLAVLGKSYSEHPLVTSELMKDGFLVLRAQATQKEREAAPRWLRRIQDGLFTSPESSFTPAHFARDALLQRLRGETSRLLLIDDGGDLIRLVNDIVAGHPELARKVVAVEQTRRGIDKLAGVTLHFPVIDVARSWAKARYEAPLIGRSVANAVERRLRELRAHRVPTGRRVLVAGYGTVGREIAREMRRRGYPVVAYDRRPTARSEAAEDGIPLFHTVAEAFPQGDLVISSTGEIVVTQENLGQLPDGAVLFNAGSQNTEFDPHMKLPGFQPKPGDSFASVLWQRMNVTTFFRGVNMERLDDWAHPSRGYAVLRSGAKEYLMAHWGGVVNFDGVDPIPARYIQLTRGLLYLGAVQASRGATPGIHPLEAAPQHELVRAIDEELGRRRESLARPRF